MNLQNRIVITGMGVTCPLATGVDPLWEKMLDGKTSIRNLSGTNPELADYPVQIGSVYTPEQFKEFFSPDSLEKRISLRGVGNPKELSNKRIANYTRYATEATHQALENANLLLPGSGAIREKGGLVIGTGGGATKEIQQGTKKALEEGLKKLPRLFILNTADSAAGHISSYYNLLGTASNTTIGACSSAAFALKDALLNIQAGYTPFMVVTGTEAYTELGLAGFCNLRALTRNFNENPERSSRPCDKDRSGFVFAEGAGAIVLETLEHAQERSAKIYAELLSVGQSKESSLVKANDEQAQVRAMRQALKRADIESQKINCLYGHLTSTLKGDEIESKAIREVFRDGQPYITATKSLVGHTLGASAMFGIIPAIKTLEKGLIPPTINLENIADDCNGVNLVTKKTFLSSANYVMINSLAFHGNNFCIVLGEYN